jgi:hypothetical protein
MTFFNQRLFRACVVSAVLLCVALSMCGCEAFARKFTRKQKKKEQPVESMVLSPEVYPDSQASKQDSYRQYFTFWSSWHDELIDNLSETSPSVRRQMDSVQEAINSLEEMKKLLQADRQTLVDPYLSSMAALKSAISQDLYANNIWSNRSEAEKLKRQISRALQYSQVKDFIK